MFEYKKGKTPISKLSGFQKKWRHYWNRVALKKFDKISKAKGEKFRVCLNPEGKKLLV